MSTTPTPPRQGFGIAIVGTIIPTVLGLALFVLYATYVPAAKKTFDEFSMTLPLATQYAIGLSNWMAEYWWIMAPVFVLLAAGNFALLVLMSQQARLFRVLWIAGSNVLLVAILALTIVAIELPMTKLKEALAN